MATPVTLLPLGIAPHLPLPSAGITRHPRYFGLSATLPAHVVPVGHATGQGFPCCVHPSSMRAAAITPAVGACASVPTEPSPFLWRVGFHITRFIDLLSHVAEPSHVTRTLEVVTFE